MLRTVPLRGESESIYLPTPALAGGELILDLPTDQAHSCGQRNLSGREMQDMRWENITSKLQVTLGVPREN